MSQNIGKVKGHVRETFKMTTTRPVAILMIVIGVFVFGWQSYEKLPLNLMPEISYPSLTVRTEYPGAAPEEVENNVSKRIESALAVVDDLVNISSISKPGLSDVILEFSWNTDMNIATSDVREKLDQVFLPEEAERPLILRYDPSLDPIIRVAFYATENKDNLTQEEMATELRDYAEHEIREKLESVKGVAAARIRGGLERERRGGKHECPGRQPARG
jgi:HAE1 family hydrophobic/amphiphilic exporter-1